MSVGGDGPYHPTRAEESGPYDVEYANPQHQEHHEERKKADPAELARLQLQDLIAAIARQRVGTLDADRVTNGERDNWWLFKWMFENVQNPDGTPYKWKPEDETAAKDPKGQVHGASWCGISAADIVQRATGQNNVKFQLWNNETNTGGIRGLENLNPREPDPKTRRPKHKIEKGDILVLYDQPWQTNVHHECVVVRVSVDPKTHKPQYDVVNGNDGNRYTLSEGVSIDRVESFYKSTPKKGEK